ncbi:tryptophan 2,3-dioxygenase [Streptomyces sp. NPDC052101]|uniref:tryptophan 2,3-dioxygenase n=1 Tax=Streptomyces sp. NPDC052101 TaxID=3155763 RepID=UPI0034415E91
MAGTEEPLWRELSGWRGAEGAKTFPYDAVIDHLREVGKHFLSPRLLALLDTCRQSLAERTGEGDTYLARFLDVLLDKYDGSYDYPSYTGLPLFQQSAPEPAEPAGNWTATRHRRDRLVLLLLADLIEFEQLVLDGTPADPQGALPDPALLGKRLRLAVRVMEPAALRVLDSAVDPVSVAATPGRTPARPLAMAVLAAAADEERLLLRTSVQPVYVLHDEYLFLRVLQTFETTFAFMSRTLDAAVRALTGEQPGDAATLIASVADVLRESLPLFSLLATMQPESFQVFRQYTDGASAIQSEGYKTFETYCSTPARARLDSPAFTAVPRVREAVLAGRETVQGTWEDVVASGWLTEQDAGAVRAAARQLEAVHQRWKQTHYRLAVRMIGERTGTGSTEGVPYLKSVIANRLFPAVQSGPSPVAGPALEQQPAAG